MSAAAVDESSFKEYQESTTSTLEWTVRGLKQLFDSSKGEQKSKVSKSVKFGGGRWQILLYPNSGHEGGYVSLYLSCEPTQEEKDNAINGRWVREGLFKFSFDLKTVNKTNPVVFNTKEACDHAFSYKTMNWGWAQFAKRDSVYYSSPAVRQADAFLIVCTITSSPIVPEVNSGPTVARQHVPKSLMDAVGSMLNDPTYSDVEFVLPTRTRGRKGSVKRIYANKKILSQTDYFETMFKSGFAEGAAEESLLFGTGVSPSGVFAGTPTQSDVDEDPRLVDDSDESDEETENDTTSPSTPLLHLVSRSLLVPRDSTWETQSDTGAAVKRPRSDEEDSTGDTTLQEPSASTDAPGANRDSKIIVGASGNEDSAAEAKQDHSLDGQRNVRQRLAYNSGPSADTAGASPSRQKPEVPGPPKTTVVVKDVAYATYFALLYYLYTDCIVFAPLSSTFAAAHTSSGNYNRSALSTPGSIMGATQQSYFANMSLAPSMNPPARPRSMMSTGLISSPGPGNEDEPPKTRKDWVRRWMAWNPSRPPPVSAKAIYRLADKLDLADLKHRAFQHIVRSLTTSNIAYEVFSSFSASYDEVRRVEVDFFLEKWSEIRSGDAMRNVFQQIRLGRHPGFEEVWPLIVQHLVFRPDIEGGTGLGRSPALRDGAVGERMGE